MPPLTRIVLFVFKMRQFRRRTLYIIRWALPYITVYCWCIGYYYTGVDIVLSKPRETQVVIDGGAS